MNDVGALAGAAFLLLLGAVALGLFGLAAIHVGVDSRRSADEDRLGRPTRWI
ncbi:MAG TPA: hypothetical protein VFR14_05950 [Candidatus Limnocylindrales bacterium]|nr:hypothetical protein [Candidatus Limnocylindrales bacterium]